MGKYSDPAMFVNKQYEQLNKGLSNMYSNVAKNAEAIKARELKKKQQAAKRMSDWNKIYAKGTQENYQGALDFTSAMPEDSINTMQFTNQLKSVYKQGYDNIAQMVASGASEGEIASYVQDQINAANTFTEGIVAFDNFQQRYNSGIEKIGQEAGDMKGNEVGDIVVGSQYNNTFSALGIDPGDDKVPLDKLKMVGDLSTGIKFFYDKDGDGKLQEAEVLDLNTMAKNFGGGENPYFKEVEDFTEISKAYRSQLANLEKAPDFVREFSVTENGQTRKVTHVDRKKRQDYFLNENSDGGKLINEIIRTKDATMLAQSIYGYKFAEQFDPTDPVQMKMLKVGLAEKLSPSLFPGSEKLAPSASDRTTVTRTYEDKSPEIAVIENFTRPIHEDVSGYAVNNSPSKLQDLNTKYAGRPFKTSKGNELTTGIINDISVVPGQSNQNLLQISYVVNGKTEVGMNFDLNTPDGLKAFETALVHGNFPNAKKERIEGTYDGLISGEGYDDSKSTTRVSKRQGTSTLTIEDFEEQISGSDDVVSSRSLYESWKSGWAGQPSALSTSTTVSTTQAPPPSPQATTDLSINNFGGVDYSSNDLGGVDPVQYANDGSAQDQYRIILNFENTAGSSDGTHLDNYGFTGDAYQGRRPKTPEEALKIINNEIVPEVVKEIGIDKNDFESLPANIQGALVDYKFNTGRSEKDILQIAYNKAMGVSGGWDAVKSYGIDANGDKITEKLDYKKDEVIKALKEGKITPEIIAEVKKEQYLARIQGMRNMLKKDPNATNSKGVRIDALLPEAEKAFVKSHSSRVKMFI